MKFKGKIKFLFGDQNAKPVDGALPINPQMQVIQDALNSKQVDRKVLQESLITALKALGGIEDWGILHKFTIDDTPRKDVYEALKRIANTVRP